MNRLLVRSSLRALRQHPWQLALALLGIAIGVGMVAAVQLTQYSARQAMAEAQHSLVGGASARLTPLNGRLPEDTYVTLAKALPELAMMPILKASLALDTEPGGQVLLVGIDPLADIRTGASARLLGENPPGALVGKPGTALLGLALAQRLGLRPGERLKLRVQGQPASLEILGLLPAGADELVVVDLATAQELLDAGGELSSIELAPEDGAAGALGLAQLRRLLPPGVRLSSIEADIAGTRELTRAFDLNLTAMSLLALLVGMFLIYNTESFLIVQRRAQFAQLRALGVSARELAALLLGEAFVMGAIGSTLGLLLGEGIARALLARVGQTVNDLYASAAINEVANAPGLLLAVWGLGVLATVVATLQPVQLAVTQSVRRRLAVATDASGEPRQRRRLLLASAFAAGFAWFALRWPSTSLLPAFAALFGVLLSGALLLPPTLGTLAGSAVRCLPLSRAPALGLGFRLVARHGGRHGLAAAALMAASATAIAMAVMIGSFRGSVSEWLGQLLRADVYVSPLDHDSLPATRLATLRARVAKLPGVTATSSVSRTRHRLPDGSETQLVAYDLPPAARAGFQLLGGSPADLWARWETDDVAMASEPWAFRHAAKVGDVVALPTPDGGEARFRIAAIYRDYASERGNLTLSRATYVRHFGDVALDGFGVYAAPGAPLEPTLIGLRTLLHDEPVRLQTRGDVQRQSLVVFDRTFAVTDILRLVALGVAVLGLVSALLAQQFERLREYGLLRALGLSAGDLTKVILGQTLLLGVVAATCALPLGAALAMVLIEVVNVRSFGWTMQVHVPWMALASNWLLAVAAALLAGLYPAWRVVRQAPASVMRNE